MVSELLEGASYIALAIAAWPVCKYLAGPIFGYQDPQLVRAIGDTHKQVMHKAYEERGRAMVELAKVGKTPEEISDILDSSLPLPED